MENREYLNELFDIYGDLLTSTEQVTFKSYYIEDLSLSEIAENREVSKSSVGKTMNIAEEKLKNYESILKIHKKKEKLLETLNLRDIESIKKTITEVLNK